MKLKLLLLTAVAAVTATAAAQQVTITRQRDLGVTGFYPVLNASADRVLFTDLNADGLSALTLATGDVTRITDAPGAGISPAWDASGNVYFMSQTVGDDRMIYRAGNRYDAATARTTQVLAPQRGAVRPLSSATGNVAIRGTKSYRSTASTATTVYTDQSTLVINDANGERRLSPVESFAGYLWASLSPDGTRIAFVAAETGVYVIDLEGNILSRLGRYEMPSWLDDDHLVGQHATDDGYQFTSSQLMLLAADGSFSRELTAPASMTMQPCAARGQIVYTTIDGHLRLMSIEISK